LSIVLPFISLDLSPEEQFLYLHTGCGLDTSRLQF
jgi:hypothetical protein